LNPDGEWAFIDGNLHSWGGWVRGQLIYATDGRDLRPLAGNGNVWVSDIKVLDQRDGKIRTVVSGVSMNSDPQWCNSK